MFSIDFSNLKVVTLLSVTKTVPGGLKQLEDNELQE